MSKNIHTSCFTKLLITKHLIKNTSLFGNTSNPANKFFKKNQRSRNTKNDICVNHQ